MTFKRFEDIESWQMARDLCKIVKRLTEKEPFCKDWTLRNQIRASSGSAMDCIAEGHERGHNKEFVYFLGIAKGSCAETRSQGYRAFDYNYISQQESNEIGVLTLRICAAIQALINHLNRSEIKGQRSHILPSEIKQATKINQHQYFPDTPPPGY